MSTPVLNVTLNGWHCKKKYPQTEPEYPGWPLSQSRHNQNDTIDQGRRPATATDDDVTEEICGNYAAQGKLTGSINYCITFFESFLLGRPSPPDGRHAAACCCCWGDKIRRPMSLIGCDAYLECKGRRRLRWEWQRWEMMMINWNLIKRCPVNLISGRKGRERKVWDRW